MRAPGALAPLGIGAIVIAFSTDHPLVLGAVLAGALALYAAAPSRPSRLFLFGGIASGAGLALLNPFVSAEGDLILWQGPEVSLIDLEVTLEEVALGVAIGVRLAAVAILVGALLAHVDPDRLQAQVARVAPRSALTCALAARLVPTLQRDARAISEAARLRGLALTEGRWLGRARRAAPLTLPLLGSSLERGLDVAEAMTARGYGSGARTRVAEAAYGAGERVALAIGAALVGLAAAALALGMGRYDFYPTMDPVLSADGLTLAAGVLAALAGAALALRP